MFWGSCAHTHQSVSWSVGAPTPISLWKALIAVPQRKPSGKGNAAPARAVAGRRVASRTIAARFMVGSYATRGATVNPETQRMRIVMAQARSHTVGVHQLTATRRPDAPP